MPDLPISTVEELGEKLSRPCPAVTEALAAVRGDGVVLGASGKMGPSLARMARRALDARSASSRWRDSLTPAPREDLEKAGVETIACDL